MTEGAWGLKGVGKAYGKMQKIDQILKYNPRPVNSRVTREFQVRAFEIIKKLNIPRKRYSAYFAVCKRENPALIGRAFSFAADYPNVFARDKMFFWKLNELKRNLPIDKNE